MTEMKRCRVCGSLVRDERDSLCQRCLLQKECGSPPSLALGQATVEYHSQEVPATAAPAGVPAPGDELGDYLLVRSLGRGGMGTVFEAEDRNTGRRLPLKILRQSLESPTVRQRFLREGQLVASVSTRSWADRVAGTWLVIR